MQRQYLQYVGAAALVIFIFGTSAILVPMTMDDVPERSRSKLLTTYQEAVEVIERTFHKHQQANRPGRLMPIPGDTRSWIELINPMGKKAPGGGPAVLPQADATTGAIGLEGNRRQVVITIPAYRELKTTATTIVAPQ